MTNTFEQTPSLFGQKHSNRDYSKEEYWGKNQFNSSFPASLVAYMYSKGLDAVYLCTDKKNLVIHKAISGKDILGIDPLSDEAFYNFESGFFPFEKFYYTDTDKDKKENIDLVMFNKHSESAIRGLEIKLTALPDNTTCNLSEDKYSCEIVVRPPTICFLACSICEHYSTDKKKEKLRKLLSGVPKINHWEEAAEVAPHFDKIRNTILQVSSDMTDFQTPLIIQPIWKTQGKLMRLAPDCLDIFVWSNLATIQMFCDNEENVKGGINRLQRSIIWLYLMLFDYAHYGKFDYSRIIKLHSYKTANDKAFSLPGNRSYQFLKCDELTHPRINKNEIKNIILGGGQYFLRPERRFDAVLVNSPDIFD